MTSNSDKNEASENPRREGLSSEEYKNIALRTKEELKRTIVTWIIAATGVATLLVGGGVWLTVRETARSVTERQVESITESDAFIRRVVKTTERRLPQLQQLVSEAQGTADTIESRLNAVESIPFRIGEESVILTDSSGRGVKIEFGVAERREVEFQNSFASEPAVFTSVSGLKADPPGSFGDDNVKVVEVSKTGFRVVSTERTDPTATITAHSWIAIGRRE